jgi:hypothetical protein
MSRFVMLPLLLLTLLLAATASMAPASRVAAEGACVFPFTPTT